jgi:HD domain
MDVRAADLVEESARLAEELVRPLGRRWAHVQAVARAADALRPAVRAGDGPVLVAAAWLHDVGYTPDLVDTGFHPLDGARYLRNAGFPGRVVNLVAHHSGARFEAAERGLADELTEFECEDSAVMDALVTADLTTGPGGETLSYRDRIADILQRYPPNDPVHRAWLKAADPLEISIQRTRGRTEGYPINGRGLSSR